MEKTLQTYEIINSIFNRWSYTRNWKRHLRNFYENLFQPSPDCKIINNRKLTKNTISKLLNKTLSLDREENNKIMEAFAQKNDIKFSCLI